MLFRSTGMTAAGLQTTYDTGMQLFKAAAAGSPEVPGIVTADANNDATGQTFCISAKDNGYWAHVVGPGGTVKEDGQVAADPCP